MVQVKRPVLNGAILFLVLSVGAIESQAKGLNGKACKALVASVEGCGSLPKNPPGIPVGLTGEACVQALNNQVKLLQEVNVATNQCTEKMSPAICKSTTSEQLCLVRDKDKLERKVVNNTQKIERYQGLLKSDPQGLTSCPQASTEGTMTQQSNGSATSQAQ